MRAMRRWVRPYGQDDQYALRYVVAGFMSVAGLFPICGALSQADGEVTAADAPWLLAIVGYVVLFEIVVWRWALYGVYVSDFGVKVRTFYRTRVLPWSRITRAWAGPAAHYDAWQIWISVRDPERDIETPIWRKGSRQKHSNRVVLPPDEFAATLAALDPQRSSSI